MVTSVTPVTHGAIAIFVKTPDFSDVKTRLAETVGKESAERFYTLSVLATQAVIKKAVSYSSWLTPYWAIAEEQAMTDERWNQFSRIYQGEGNLGDRLGHVYSELLTKHHFVLLIGADSPHLTVDQLLQPALLFCESTDSSSINPLFTLGPTDDGGFYLFGGRTSISQQMWQTVPYSRANTASELKRLLSPHGMIRELPPNFDIDTVDDLKKLATQNTLEFIPEQKAVVKFAQDTLQRLDGGDL
ncbi:MAG: DUF2064 domain-containing protein [Bacteriovoracia bacterium]